GSRVAGVAPKMLTSSGGAARMVAGGAAVPHPRPTTTRIAPKMIGRRASRRAGNRRVAAAREAGLGRCAAMGRSIRAGVGGPSRPRRLRNTWRGSVEPVVPLEPGRVRMYTCGPTVYRYAHVGNLRSYLLADLIRRVLLYHGLEVVHVKNITDVGHLRDERFDRGEDRMLVAAGLESKSPAEIAAAYEAAFHADEAAVNILPAHVFPRATEHIDDMLATVEQLAARSA